jgi:TRAP-type C4-dicarboxylate transport system substrate-binding protein
MKHFVFQKKSKTIVFLIWILMSIPFASSESRELKFATVISEGGPGVQEMRRTFSRIEKESDNEIKIRLYANSISGDEIETVKSVRLNRVQIGQFSGLAMGTIVPDIRVVDSPDLFQNYAEADFIRDTLFPEFASAFAKKGYVLLGFGEAGIIYIFSKLPIKTPEDFQKMKMWSWRQDLIADFYFENLGMATVPVQLKDVLVALRNGAIDTFFAPPMFATSFQWYTMVRFMLDYRVTNALAGFLMNKSTFDGLSENGKLALTKGMREYTGEWNAIIRRANKESFHLIENAGIEIVRPQGELLDYLKANAPKTARRHIEKGLYPQELYDRVQKLLIEYRSRPPVRKGGV